MVMCQMICMRVAPSTLAASIIWSSMPLMAARYMMAAQPAFFQVSHSHILNQICSEDFRKAMGLSTNPSSISTEFTAPEVENRLKAKAYTSTQLMKFGRVVTVCTNFLKGLH